MKIYLASGFSVMNVPGRERELFFKLKDYKRLVSFWDTYAGNNIFQIINLKKEIQKT